ncbi:sigma-70 family RNA polymerase sigma factor [Umezawaea sp. Da 62-37]|uniref:sigma-70 family RNA polymerase sigma factor n=1 Tax=Umezawaea sp. Da 62-37 TaxID=3075927 RepID=UPI0028F7402F|nr:sigma-70 family RNA polymerase sigma factor [Umezawaea sp. Da 62-37]WNV90539.1 sigma-70 family RNA polymerase sigma factor [Umezawaea sp. Da 62-37]
MRRSFEDFADAEVTPMLRYATVLTCDAHLAQDVVQECLLRAQQKWQRIGDLDQPAAYVKKMITNEYLSWRRRKAAKDVTMSHAALDDVGTAATDAVHRYDERDAMLRRIVLLPRKQRAAVVLRYYDGLADDEISEVLGCAEVTVRSHISRALTTLRATQKLLEAR